MALQVTGIERIFIMKGKDSKEDVRIPDPNPEFTPDEVLNFLSNTYPELTTATIKGPDQGDGQIVYTFEGKTGTKG